MAWKKELRDLLDGFFDSPGSLQSGFGLFGMGPTEAGVDVNETTSMTVGAVAACQRIISSAMASLPCYVYQRMPNGGHRLATEHPLFSKFSLSPCPDYPAVDFFAAGQINLLQNGNGYAEIIRTNGGDESEFLLRSPFKTMPYRDVQTGKLIYKTTDTADGKERTINAADMIHPKGMGTNPYIGLSPIRMYMREVIGTALAAQAYGARLFKNDTRPGGYLASPNTIKPDQKLTQIQSWIAGHSAGNNHMPAYLDGGVEWKSVGITPEEAQFLSTRQFQRSEIASIYGVPAHMLGDPQETKATIEQKALEFLLWTVKIWCRRWEQAINVKCFAPQVTKSGPKPKEFFVKFDTSEFERADYATTLKGIQTGRYAGLYSVDEGRRLLGLNPSSTENFDPENQGASLWRPVNMAIAGDDPGKYASGGSNPADGVDTPADDSEAPADDGSGSRSIEFHYGAFEARLEHLEALKKPDSKQWMRIIKPVFEALSEGMIAPEIIEATVLGMEVQGVAHVRANYRSVLTDFQAMVRAAKAEAPETGKQCE